MKHVWKRSLTQYAIFLPYTSSILLFLSFIAFKTSGLVFIALVPYVFYLYIEKSKKKFRIILPTWLMGLMFLLFSNGWLIAADTHGWVQISGIGLHLIIFCLWLALGLVLSVGFLCLGLTLKFFIKRVSFSKLSIFILPISWAISEFIRSYFFSILAYGRGATIGPNWNFSALGYAATATPLGILSRLGGLYGMSMLAVLINVILFLLLRKKYQFSIIVSFIIALAVTVIYLATPKSTNTVRISTVQLASDDNNYYQALSSMIRSTPETSRQSSDILVLPEYSFFFEAGTPEQEKAVTNAAFKNKNGLIIYTRSGPKKNSYPTNEIIVKDANNHPLASEQKSFLIPTGEYLPWIIAQSLRTFGQASIVDNFNHDIAIAKSNTKENTLRVQNQKLGVLACSGVIAPELYRSLVQSGSTILINSASLNEFRNAPLYHQQARQFAHFEAIANDRPFIQSSRGGYSFIIDRNGNYLVDFDHSGLAVGAASVSLTQTKTLYSEVGEWTLWLGLLTLLTFVKRQATSRHIK